MGVQFTDKFIQEPDNVTLLLTLLEVGLESAGIICYRGIYMKYFKLSHTYMGLMQSQI